MGKTWTAQRVAGRSNVGPRMRSQSHGRLGGLYPWGKAGEPFDDGSGQKLHNLGAGVAVLVV